MEGVENLLTELRKDGLLVQGAGAPIWWPEHPSGGWSIHLVAVLTVSSKSVLYGPPETNLNTIVRTVVWLFSTLREGMRE